MVIPLDKVQSAVALGFDSDTDRIYWTDVEANSISRSYLNGTQQEVVINTNLGKNLKIISLNIPDNLALALKN